jgi:hypothetical protein
VIEEIVGRKTYEASNPASSYTLPRLTGQYRPTMSSDGIHDSSQLQPGETSTETGSTHRGKVCIFLQPCETFLGPTFLETMPNMPRLRSERG